jgi:hypothetical protein
MLRLDLCDEVQHPTFRGCRPSFAIMNHVLGNLVPVHPVSRCATLIPQQAALLTDYGPR